MIGNASIYAFLCSMHYKRYAQQHVCLIQSYVIMEDCFALRTFTCISTYIYIYIYTTSTSTPTYIYIYTISLSIYIYTNIFICYSSHISIALIIKNCKHRKCRTLHAGKTGGAFRHPDDSYSFNLQATNAFQHTPDDVPSVMASQLSR